MTEAALKSVVKPETEFSPDGKGKVSSCPLDKKESKFVGEVIAEVAEVKDSEKGTGARDINNHVGRKRRMGNSNYLQKYLKNAQQRRGPVSEKGVKGKVKWYNLWSRYGFITRDDGDNCGEKPKDVFVHQSAIANSRLVMPYLRTLCLNEPVEFDIVEGRNGPEADNVSGPEGHPVKGIPFYLFNIYANRRGMKRFRNKEEGEDEKSESDKVTDEKKNSRRRYSHRRRYGARNKGKDVSEEEFEGHERKEKKTEGRRRECKNDSEEREKKQADRRRKRHKRKHHKKANEKKENDEENHPETAAKSNSATPELQLVVTTDEKFGIVEVESVNAETPEEEAKVFELIEEVVETIANLNIDTENRALIVKDVHET